jgi:hypothetical protein
MPRPERLHGKRRSDTWKSTDLGMVRAKQDKAVYQRNLEMVGVLTTQHLKAKQLQPGTGFGHGTLILSQVPQLKILSSDILKEVLRVCTPLLEHLH